MYLRVEYADQNERFASHLPKIGKVVRKPKCSDSQLEWYLLCLNQTLRYDDIEYSHFLLASRWQGYFIGDERPVPVYILLVPSSYLDVLDGFSYEQFLHVAWGMASVIPDQPDTNGD